MEMSRVTVCVHVGTQWQTMLVNDVLCSQRNTHQRCLADGLCKNARLEYLVMLSNQHIDTGTLTDRAAERSTLQLKHSPKFAIAASQTR